MKHFLTISVFLAVACLGCKPGKDTQVSKTTSPTDTPGPVISLNSFPLTVGNMWVYDNGDTIRAVTDTTIGGITATKLVKRNGNYTAAIYCANQADGMHVLGSNWKFGFEELTGPLYSGSEAGDTVQYPNPSILMIKLPVAITNSWDVHIAGYEHFRRQWVSYVTVTTPAGTFKCVKMTTPDLNEYYSDKGLVQTVGITECLVAPCPVFVTKLVYVNF